jgi:hypothetical protein
MKISDKGKELVEQLQSAAQGSTQPMNALGHSLRSSYAASMI